MSEPTTLTPHPVGQGNASTARPPSFLGSLKGIIDIRVVSMLVIFAALAIVFHALSGGLFFTPRNLSLLLRQASLVAIVAAGVSILMVMGEIDLSIGSSVYLCSVVAATLQVTYGFDTLSTIVVTLAVGVLLGAWQGIWVVAVSVPSFVVTLAGLLAFRGIGYYATDAATIAPVSDAFGAVSEAFVPIPTSYIFLAICVAIVVALFARQAVSSGQRRVIGILGMLVTLVTGAFLAWIFGGFRGIPTAVLWVVGCGLVLSILMSRTKFGRNAYLVGSNREASLLAGISLGRQLFYGFLLMGVLYGLGGVLSTARLGSSTPTTGTYLELDAIAAAVIGGTSLRGGIGTAAGAIIGAVLLATIDNGMSILNVSSFIQLVVKGLVLLFALAFDTYMARHRQYRM